MRTPNGKTNNSSTRFSFLLFLLVDVYFTSEIENSFRQIKSRRVHCQKLIVSRTLTVCLTFSTVSIEFRPSKAIHRAVALHSFQAQSNRYDVFFFVFLFIDFSLFFYSELPFKKGETFLVQRRINDDWLEGEHQGVTGIFPANHVELFPIESSGDETQGEAIVKFDFIPQKTFELQLRKVFFTQLVVSSRPYFDVVFSIFSGR